MHRSSLITIRQIWEMGSVILIERGLTASRDLDGKEEVSRTGRSAVCRLSHIEFPTSLILVPRSDLGVCHLFRSAHHALATNQAERSEKRLGLL
jgi:hypothetical protein